MLAEMKNIVKMIPDGDHFRTQLDNISLSIDKEEIVAISGDSGSGKHLLLRILACLETLSEGEYTFQNTLITNMSPSGLANIRRSYIGFIGFTPEFIENMSINEALDLPLYNLEISQKEKNLMKKEVLVLSGLLNKKNHIIDTLSLYEKKSLSIARAFIKNPPFIVAYEPFSTLHSEEFSKLSSLVETFLRKVSSALVYTSSDSRDLVIAQKIINLKDGTIMKAGEH